MKTKLLLLLLLANFSIYAQINLIQNGKFEDWNPDLTIKDWTIQNSVKRELYYSTKYEFCANLSLTNSTSRPKIIASIPLSAGITYTIKYKYKYVNSNFSGSHPISLNISQDGAANTLSSSTFATNNEWTLKEATFTADQSLSYNLSISTFSFDDEAFDVLIDNVQVYVQGTEQYTLIPDVNFEKKLIDLKIDSGETNGKVLTENISELTYLSLRFGDIVDLTGIQDFKALKSFNVGENQLTSIDLTHNTELNDLFIANNNLTTIDLSKNTKLKELNCSENNLTSLDLSANTLMTSLDFSINEISSIDVSGLTSLLYLTFYDAPITTIDISKNKSLRSLMARWSKLKELNLSENTELTSLTCDYTSLKTLDVTSNTKIQYLDLSGTEIKTIDLSKNTDLISLVCSNTQISTLDLSDKTSLIGLECKSNPNLNKLNLKNGNNVNFLSQFTYKTGQNGSVRNSNFTGNTNLSCILVDDVNYSNNNWSTYKDNTVSYSANCTLGLETSIFAQAAVYPNPTKGEINITNVSLEKADVYNVLGQLVKSVKLNSSNTDNTINLSGLPKGVYYVYLINQDAASAKKIIVE